jgi:hypothetical protein
MASFDWLFDLRPLFAAQKSWDDGTYTHSTTAHLCSPTDLPFGIACGAGLLAEHIRRFRVTPNVVQRLGQVTDAQGRSVFHESFLNHLQRLRLRAHVSAAPEGTLMLPGEPILVAQGPKLQIQLLESAFRLLIWKSTLCATEAAMQQWQSGHFSEEETPNAPPFSFNEKGWELRARYIGGASDFAENKQASTEPAWPGMALVEHAPSQPLVQVRRLFKGENPLADVWLSAAQEAAASVSHTHIQFLDEKTRAVESVQMTRFQNLLQPVLVKGHPALSTPSLDYLRQRTWKQLEAFRAVGLEGYRHGWLA